MYVIIYDDGNEIIADNLFEDYKEARKYIEAKINERDDLLSDDEDVILFENNDIYYIKRIINLH